MPQFDDDFEDPFEEEDDDEVGFMDLHRVAPGELSSSQLDRLVGQEEDVEEDLTDINIPDPTAEFKTPASRRDVEDMKRLLEEEADIGHTGPDQ